MCVCVCVCLKVPIGGTSRGIARPMLGGPQGRVISVQAQKGEGRGARGQERPREYTNRVLNERRRRALNRKLTYKLYCNAFVDGSLGAGRFQLRAFLGSKQKNKRLISRNLGLASLFVIIIFHQIRHFNISTAPQTIDNCF